MTIKLVIPSPTIEPGKSKFQLVSREADSIPEALKLMRSDVDKDLDMGHCKIVILNSELGQENFPETLYWFIRRHDVQRIEYIALAEPSAKALLELSPKSERLAANSLFLIFGQEGTETPLIVTVYMYDFYSRMLEKGKDPYLPIITIREEAYEINRVALFNKEKIVMTLSTEETGIFSQLVRKQSQLVIKASEGGLNYVLSVEDYDHKYYISESNPHNPQINMDVTIKAVAEESNQPLFDKDWTKLEEIAEKQIKDRYLTLFEQMKRNEVDPIGFGLRYIATHHNGEKDWEKWNQIYPKVKFNVKINVILKGTGVIK
ncbi:Ger(x)C family spore germination protein [Cytobacillus oceanisediminis]|uniref:Ger(x)C family spore germination protein n=1 Tax=Cytobacillus oceanisediminis TaxID=665099 RepID=UPI00203C3F89|nr:Ger(x)C family spore germination protein [Cytobacillus oceanisediminis]MCM3405338.1 Ger(x)C family spore germination protein [Cytobacillus oceanisediminis]